MVITGFEPVLITILFLSLLIGIVAIVVVIIILLSRSISFDRLDLHVFNIPEDINADEFFEELIRSLNRLGYSGVRRDNKYVIVVDSVVKTTLELVRDRKPMILYYAGVDTWFALLMLILLLTPLVWAIVVVGLLLYLRYDGFKRVVFTTVSNLLRALTTR